MGARTWISSNSASFAVAQRTAAARAGAEAVEKSDGCTIRRTFLLMLGAPFRCATVCAPAEASVVDPLEILSRHPYFAPLPEHVLAAVRRRVITRGYEKGTLIYAEGEPSQGLYLVGAGGVRIFKSSEDGREQDLHRITPGQSFSDAAAFDGAPTVANAQTTEPTLVPPE